MSHPKPIFFYILLHTCTTVKRGRPILYGTTDTFLKNFGFTSIKDLPEIDDIESAINVDVDAEEEKDPVAEGQMTIEF